MTNPPRRIPRRARLRLLAIAREAVLSKLARGEVPEFAPDEPELDELAGAFVSLHVGERLRGCIGTLYPERPLRVVVPEMAGEAATSDPRFHPLTTRELRETDIEISVLTPFERIAPEAIEVGRHGLYVVQGSRRGVLLPQVPVQFGWDREEFLAHACQKAGLPSDAWRDHRTLLMGFEAEVFSDLGEAAAEDAALS